MYGNRISDSSRRPHREVIKQTSSRGFYSDLVSLTWSPRLPQWTRKLSLTNPCLNRLLFMMNTDMQLVAYSILSLALVRTLLNPCPFSLYIMQILLLLTGNSCCACFLILKGHVLLGLLTTIPFLDKASFNPLWLCLPVRPNTWHFLHLFRIYVFFDSA